MVFTSNNKGCSTSTREHLRLMRHYSSIGVWACKQHGGRHFLPVLDCAVILTCHRGRVLVLISWTRNNGAVKAVEAYEQFHHPKNYIAYILCGETNRTPRTRVTYLIFQKFWDNLDPLQVNNLESTLFCYHHLNQKYLSYIYVIFTLNIHMICAKIISNKKKLRFFWDTLVLFWGCEMVTVFWNCEGILHIDNSLF